MPRNSGLLGDIREGAVPVVVKELIGQPMVGVRMAVEAIFGGTAGGLGELGPSGVDEAATIERVTSVDFNQAG
jgi:hypothetical protein